MRQNDDPLAARLTVRGGEGPAPAGSDAERLEELVRHPGAPDLRRITAAGQLMLAPK